jgi:DNA-binding IclR family transcriptional regulator
VATKAGASAAIVDTLRDRGGRIENASVRGLASLINATKSNVHNALMALVAAGVVARVAGGGLVLQA